MVNVANLLTLRYDPEVDNNGTIRNISYKQVLNLRQSSDHIPSSPEVEAVLRKKIRNQIHEFGAKRISLAISAGIDSNLIFCLIKKEFPEIELDCLTVTFDNEDDISSEVLTARKIAESQNAAFHEIYVGNPLKDLPLLISIIKEPRWNIYQYYFIEKASTISKVLFTGDGGDELFGGYTFRYKKFIENLKSDHSWVDRVRLYLLCHERDWVQDQESMFGSSVEFKWSSIYETLKQYFDNDLDPLEQVLLADYHGKLMYDFVPTNQKYFTHFGINGVAPLLSEDVITLSEKIPARVKYDYQANIGKIPLREILKRNVSQEISHLIEDKKMGFSMDLTKFWIKYGKEIVTSNLDRARIFEDNIINRDWYFKSMRRIDEDKFNVRDISKMLQLLSLEIWYRLFVTCEITPKFCL
ncbi:MAG TPA: asparagine synthase C-terminal domain-containing protein [Nitrososphaeraceae archaeon]|nr:asparagine synthase C-terminal domain-containing protein [Nitrososphaeraceae archaeon]